MNPVEYSCSFSNEPLGKINSNVPKIPNSLHHLTARIFQSSLFWALIGTTTLVITTIAVIINPALIPFALVPYALGIAMLGPAIANGKRFILEGSFGHTVLHYQNPIRSLKRPWSHDIIDNKLTLGAMPLVNYHHVQKFKDKGITAVLTILEPFEWNQSNMFGTPVQGNDWRAKEIHHGLIHAVDFKAPTQENLKDGVEFIRRHLQDENGHVYIHCKAGVGRSATIVVCYLMQYGTFHGLPAFKNIHEAIHYVRQKRPTIKIRQRQIKALEEYFSNLKANKSS